MRRTLLVALMLLPATAQAATQFTLDGTYPTSDNAGTCAAPLLVPNPSSLIKMHFRWSGTAAGEDSIAGTKGFTFTFTRQVPVGNYNVLAWPSDAGGAGCDTTLSLTVVLDTKPQLPRITGRGY